MDAFTSQVIHFEDNLLGQFMLDTKAPHVRLRRLPIGIHHSNCIVAEWRWRAQLSRGLDKIRGDNAVKNRRRQRADPAVSATASAGSSSKRSVKNLVTQSWHVLEDRRGE